MSSGQLREALFLIGQGIPFDVAMRLPDEDRAAWCIIFSEQNGAKFNWHKMDFETPK